MMMRITSIAALASAAVLAGCSSFGEPAQPVSTVRTEPTYQSAETSNFLASSQEAINNLTANVPTQSTGTGPVLVATIVNVNNTGASSPLGRTLSEVYANQMVARGFHVKEVKLRSDLYVREGTGELILPNGEVAVTASGRYMKRNVTQIVESDFIEDEWFESDGKDRAEIEI